jgi:multifunctional methyltransferase subunit TRM112
MRFFCHSLQATEICINSVEFNPDFLAQMIHKMKWAVLVQAADTTILAEVNKEPSDSYEQDEMFLRKMNPHVA